MRSPRVAAVRDAWGVWNANTDVRWELEARLLTDQTYDAIAGHCRLTSDIVAAYTEVFFAVVGGGGIVQRGAGGK